MKKQIPEAFATAPCVYAVGKEYQIAVPVTEETVMWVKVGEECFFDDSNGILRSAKRLHMMRVPAELLDREKQYTVCYRVLYERKPYFSKIGDVETYTSAFRPVSGSPIRAYHLADAHNRVESPVAAAGYFGDSLDLLILNGDIPNHSGKIENFDHIHQITAEVTGGEIPTVFVRGNHDLRGNCAELLAEYVPGDNGNSYYTFRVGSLWGICLDCGEDKCDAHEEYGGTICCEAFRKRETAFLRDVIANAEGEYLAPGVENRVVICHVPFTRCPKPPFDIEDETYREWARLLREQVKPQIMLSGHEHRAAIREPGGKADDRGQPCPVVLGSVPGDENFIGAALTLFPDRCEVRFTDSTGAIRLPEEGNGIIPIPEAYHTPESGVWEIRF